MDDKLRHEHASDVNQEIAQDIHLRTVRYNTHEFIKINKVGAMISDAVQGLVDRLNTKDKITAANKAMIRTMDQKQKNMEASINGLLRLTKQVGDHHTKLRAL